ncbi:MAG: heavy metal translocating P-type ATPase [Bacteroidia bacterium]
METETDEILIKVNGMHCQSCAATVTGALKSLGMDNIAVSYTACEATFTNTPHKDINAIIKSIDSLGYSASLPQAGKEEKVSYALEIRVLISSLLTLPLFLHMFLPLGFLNNPLVQLALCLPVFVMGLLYFGKSALGSLMVKTPNMDVLITMGFCASFFYSLIVMRHYPEMRHSTFFESCATIITLVFVGNLIEKRSVRQTTSALTELLKIQKHKAHKVVTEEGKEELIETDYRDLQPGDILQVVKGESIPVDGILTEGKASVNEAMVSGESAPVHKNPGDNLVGGTIIVTGHLRMRAEKVGHDTVVAGIIDMVKKAQGSAPKIQRVGDKVSAVFVPIVIAISILTFLLCRFIFNIPFENSILNSIAVLVVACPCAMGLATPTAVAVALGRAAQKGILIKGADTMEALAAIETIALDKTGTLTTGAFTVKQINPLNEEIKNVLFSMEQYSTHPIAKSISAFLKDSAKKISLNNVHEEEGLGMSATDNGAHSYRLGSYKIAEKLTAENHHSAYLVKDEKLMATIDLEDEIRKNAASALRELEEDGIHIVMISGDKEEKCREIASKLCIPEVHAEQLPYQKLDRISNLSKTNPTAMVGDGINDAPALAMANVGISLGAATKIAMQSAQVLLLSDNNLEQLPRVFTISKKTLRVIKQNLFWAFIYNIVTIPLAATGVLSPMASAFSMAFSDIVVIGNSLRLKRMI